MSKFIASLLFFALVVWALVAAVGKASVEVSPACPLNSGGAGTNEVNYACEAADGGDDAPVECPGDYSSVCGEGDPGAACLEIEGAECQSECANFVSGGGCS